MKAETGADKAVLGALSSCQEVVASLLQPGFAVTEQSSLQKESAFPRLGFCHFPLQHTLQLLYLLTFFFQKNMPKKGKKGAGGKGKKGKGKKGSKKE